MSPVLEARLTEKTLTSSNLSDDWHDCFDRNELYAANQSFTLPDFLFSFGDWKWPSQKVETARIVETAHVNVIDFIDEVKSPVLPPRNKFHIKLNIKSIRRGRPSTCDEIEL